VCWEQSVHSCHASVCWSDKHRPLWWKLVNPESAITADDWQVQNLVGSHLGFAFPDVSQHLLSHFQRDCGQIANAGHCIVVSYCSANLDWRISFEVFINFDNHLHRLLVSFLTCTIRSLLLLSSVAQTGSTQIVQNNSQICL